MQLLDLPNEILLVVLTSLDTCTLLHLTTTSKRIHSLILLILHTRLLRAATCKDHKLLLEAFHPSRRYTRPYLFCTYLGTDGLLGDHGGLDHEKFEGMSEGELLHVVQDSYDDQRHSLRKLNTLYSRFRPEHPGVAGSMPARKIAGAPIQNQAALGVHAPQRGNDSSPSPTPAEQIDDEATSSAQQTATGQLPNVSNGPNPPTQPIYQNQGDGGQQRVYHAIHLDEGELFGQFCAYASLVRLGPRRGVFLSNVDVVEPGQGTMRVWRHWLSARICCIDDADSGKGKTKASIKDWNSASDVLWIDYKRDVGLRLDVIQTNADSVDPTKDPDDEPLNCDVEIRELLVRTTHLSLAMEKSDAEKAKIGTGRALIFGNFATARTGL